MQFTRRSVQTAAALAVVGSLLASPAFAQDKPKIALIGAVVAEFVAGTGGQGAGLAYQILQAGFQLNIPRMFAALLLISLTGVALFVLMAWLTRVALGGWHASETSHD